MHDYWLQKLCLAENEHSEMHQPRRCVSFRLLIVSLNAKCLSSSLMCKHASSCQLCLWLPLHVAGLNIHGELGECYSSSKFRA